MDLDERPIPDSSIGKSRDGVKITLSLHNPALLFFFLREVRLIPKLIGSGIRVQHRLWTQAASLIEKETFSSLYLFFHSMLDVRCSMFIFELVSYEGSKIITFCK